MSIISYAQNLEDVVLWKALKDVKNGFYIDVGANDPIIDSVTNIFYQNGWHGINIEPINIHFKKLALKRPKDINLNCAISDCKGQLDIWECDVRGWATLDHNIVETHEKNGYKGEWHNVEIRTLSEVCDEYKPENIHFLKVDVEGLEFSVLKGNDWGKYRPWIVVFEATIPNTQIERYHDVEALLVEQNYIFAYADGLNRFYVAAEHKELLPLMKYPPNVFDDYQKYTEYAALYELEIIKEKYFSLKNDHDKIIEEKNSLFQTVSDYCKENELLAEQVKSIENENSIKERIIGEMLVSTSWRITRPLRFIGKIKKRSIKENVIQFLISIKKILKQIICIVNKYPRFRSKLIKFIKLVGLYSVLRTLYLNILLHNAPKTTFYTKQFGKNENSKFSLSSGDDFLSVDELHNRIKSELEVAKQKRGNE